MQNNDLKLIINNVININRKYQEIKKIKGENFNIFSILKLERNEVKTHSNFIYELINPKGSHNQGDLFLKLFMKHVLKLSDYGNINNIKIYQEYLTIQRRRIDFVIETEKYQIGIEMKIDAKDQNMQLADYMIELKRVKKEARLYYLTLTGYQASEASIGDNRIDYVCLSFEDDIYKWLIACIEKSVTFPLLREGLIHYKNLIEKITNKISKPMEEDMENIIKTPDEIRAVQTILNEYPKIWAKKEMFFLNNLKENLKSLYTKNTFEFIDTYDIWTDENEYKYSNIIENLMNKNISGFALQKEYKSGDFITLYFEISKGDTYLSIGFCDKDENEIELNENINNICDNLDFNYTNGKYRYKKIKENITFFSNKHTELTYDLFDENKYNTYVLAVVKEIEEKIIYIVKNEKKILKALSL